MKIRLGELRRIIREAMTVSTHLGPSGTSSAGTGVFAGEDVEEGDVVFSWDPQVDSEYSEENLRGLPPDELEEFQELASWDGEVWSLAGDNGAYFNHSDDPNVVAVPQPGVRPARWKRVASRRIQAGEEMTMDYSQVGTDVPR